VTGETQYLAPKYMALLEHLGGYLVILKFVLKHRPVRNSGQDLRDLPTYTLPEAATFLAMSQGKIHYWYDGPTPFLTSSEKTQGTRLLSFRDLSEAYVLQILRTHYRFSMQALRQILKKASKETGFERPLLECDLRMLFDKLILAEPGRGSRPRQMVDLSSQGRQLAIPELVDLIGKRITKDAKGNPRTIYPWRLLSQQEQSRPVSMDPDVLSGRLVVTGTRIPVRILLGMKLARKSEEEIAEIYRLDVDAVRRALLHIERPIHKKAA
jgi:uncharacterized protein (DUF433 family)